MVIKWEKTKMLMGKREGGEAFVLWKYRELSQEVMNFLFDSCHFSRLSGHDLLVVTGVTIRAFPGDFSRACILGQSVDHKPPHVIGQVGSENNPVDLNGCGILSKEERSGGQNSQTS